jgi:beta-lactamase class C
MKYFHNYFFLPLCLMVLLAIAASGCGRAEARKKCGESGNAQNSEKLNSMLNQYESLFKTQLAASGCPGAAVVIVKDSTIIFMKAFGVKEAGTQDSVDVHTLFRLGSLSKGFTSVLIGILVERGIMGWDDPVNQSVSQFTMKDENQAARLKVRHLLSHTTGLPEHTFTNLVEEGVSYEKIKRKLSEVTLIGKEGEKYTYQNFAFSLIEEIATVKAHFPFEDMMRSKLFQPGQMHDAVISYSDWINHANKSRSHLRNENRVYEVEPLNEKYFNAPSVGGVCASISDAGNWLKILLGHYPDIVSDKTLDFIFAPAVESSDGNYYDRWDGVKKSHYALGYRVLDFGGRKLIHHGGTVNEYRSEIAIDRENGIGICILFNAQSSQATTAIPTFFALFDLYSGLSD